MKVAYFYHQDIASSALRLMLIERFGMHNVVALDVVNFKPRDLKGIKLLVLPGVSGEKSPWPDFLPPDKAEILSKTAEDTGMVLWTDCAVSYWSAQEIKYHASNNTILTKKGLGWIDAVAIGPVIGKGMEYIPQYTYSDITTVAIDYYDVARIPHSTRIPYGNSPSFYLSEQEKANPNVDVFAHFTDHADKPAAALTKKMGTGLLVSLGVLPQLKPNLLAQPGLKLSKATTAQELHRHELFNEAARNEKGIFHFENVIMDRINRHFAKNGLGVIPHMERNYA